MRGKVVKRARKGAMLGASLALAALLGSAGAAGATTLVDQEPGNPSVLGGVISTGSHRAYDDFSLPTAATVTGLTWWGFFSGSNFNIQITPFLDQIEPNTAAPLVDVDITAAPTSFTSVVDQYSVTFAQPVALPANTGLYLSIYGDNNTSFNWLGSSQGAQTGPLDQSCASFGLGGQCSLITTSAGNTVLELENLSFRLDGVAAAVPEPSSWALAIVGLGLAGMALRRNRRSGYPGSRAA